MFDFHELCFVRPSPVLRELIILEALRVAPSTPQAELAKASGISPAMVNTYLRRMAEDGLVRKSGANARTMSYLLTEKGRMRLGTLLVDLSKELLGLYAAVREEFARHLRQQVGPGRRTVALYGAGDSIDLAMSAVRAAGMDICAVFDDDPSKWGSRVSGIEIRSPHEIREAERLPDLVVISTFSGYHSIKARLDSLGVQSIPLFPLTEA